MEQLAGWKPFRIVVVGDFMLDQMTYGDAERLSNDAPVPVLRVKRTESVPGGSANVCLDLAALRGQVLAVGVVGDDAAGRMLREALAAEGVDASGLVVDRSRPTTVKQNLIGLAQTRHPQKMFRLDFESSEPVPRAVARSVVDAVVRALPNVDGVCIEDYNKGVCTEEVCQGIIRAAKAAGKPVLVDPARIDDYSKYRGATAITPNRTEAEIATGLKTDADASIERNTAVAHSLLSRLDLEAAILTLDRHGALLMQDGERAISIPTVAREVYDVTGAGDMFLAGLAAARCNGASWHDAIRFANAAAGLEVEVFGVQPIPFERVHFSMLEQESKLEGKLRTLDQLRVEVEARRRAGKKIVFTNGCFDILHIGHATLLEKAARLGDFLVVGINTDASVRRLKGPERPLNNEHARAVVLGGLGCVGAVALFDEPTPIKLIEAIKPDVLVKGGDYTRETVVGADFVEKNGGRVELIPLVEGHSTTGIIQRMKKPANA